MSSTTKAIQIDPRHAAAEGRGGDPERGPFAGAIATDASLGSDGRPGACGYGLDSRLPELKLEQLYQVGGLIGQVEVRVVNSDKGRPTAEAGLLPIKRAAWESPPHLDRDRRRHPRPRANVSAVGDHLLHSNCAVVERGHGLPADALLRIPVYVLAPRHGPCAARTSSTCSAYLAQVERALMATAEDWDEQDKDLRLDKPALWYVARPTNRMRPTRLAVRTRELFDEPRQRVVLSLRQFLQPQSFQRNARALVDWLESGNVARELSRTGSWSNVGLRRFGSYSAPSCCQERMTQIAMSRWS